MEHLTHFFLAVGALLYAVAAVILIAGNLEQGALLLCAAVVGTFVGAAIDDRV